MRWAAVAAALALAGCATPHLPPATSSEFRLEDDEKALWQEAAEEQHRLDASGDVYEDPALEAYLMSVARRLQPPAAFAAVPFRIRVLKNFRLNAFALPNGAIYLHTGILARMESEAELAVLLGHEMTHATHRHAALGQRKASNTASAWAGVSAAFLGLTAPLGALASSAAVSGHGRNLEREADRVGLDLVAAAGYDLAEAPKLFRHLAEWVRSEDEEEPFFFGSHPRLEERIESCEEVVASYQGRRGAVRSAEVFRQKTARLLLANARLDLAANRLDAARRDAESHLAVQPKSAGAHAVLGEAARRRADGSGMDDAAAQYRKALQLDPRLGEAHRGLGLVQWKKGERKAARAAFARYLELEPHATDRAYIREYLSRSGD